MCMETFTSYMENFVKLIYVCCFQIFACCIEKTAAVKYIMWKFVKSVGQPIETC